MSSFHFLSLLFLFLGGFLVSAQTCFSEAGEAVEGDRPCFDSTEFSFCCGEGYTCLENFVCEYNGSTNSGVEVGQLARGTCSDPSWQSPDCPRYCEGIDPSELFWLPTTHRG